PASWKVALMTWLPSVLKMVLQVALPLPFTVAGFMVPLPQVRLLPFSVNVTDPALSAMSEVVWEEITTKSFMGAGGNLEVNGDAVYEPTGEVLAVVLVACSLGFTVKFRHQPLSIAPLLPVEFENTYKLHVPVAPDPLKACP